MIQLGYTVPLVSLDSRFSVRACFTELIKEPNFRSLFAHVYGSELYISVYRSHKQAINFQISWASKDLLC